MRKLSLPTFIIVAIVVALAFGQIKNQQSSDEIRALRDEIEALKKVTPGSELTSEDEKNDQIAVNQGTVVQEVKIAPRPNASPKPPVFTFMNPAVVVNSKTQIIEIHGNGFISGLKVNVAGATLKISSQYQPNPQTSLVWVELPGGFNPGSYALTLTNPDGGTVTTSEVLTVHAAQQQDSGPTTSEGISRASPATVLIRGASSCGSGFVVSGNRIVTNKHVVENGDDYTIFLPNGTSFGALVSKRDYVRDLAILTPDRTNLPFLSLADSNEVTVPPGTEVIALGYPQTCNTAVELVYELGNITGRQRQSDGDYLRSSAKIHSGNSGGPLILKSGQVIGVNTSGMVTSQGYNIAGISWSITSNELKDFLSY